MMTFTLEILKIRALKGKKKFMWHFLTPYRVSHIIWMVKQGVFVGKPKLLLLQQPTLMLNKITKILSKIFFV